MLLISSPDLLTVVGQNGYKVPRIHGLWADRQQIIASANGSLHYFGHNLQLIKKQVGEYTSRDLAVGEKLWVTNTKFSTIGYVDDTGYHQTWQPSFITKVGPDDACHLNGLAVRDGQPKLVTAFAATNCFSGWRQRDLTKSGLLLDIEHNATIADNLCLPHSPRYSDEKIFCLDSGRGRLVTVESGKLETVVELPGFARGLAFKDGVAYVGLSKIRPSSTFAKVPIATQNLKCGVARVELSSGRLLGIDELPKIDEIYDLAVI